MQQYWFKRRQYGWGWSPATWQGWSVLSGYGISIFAALYNTGLLTTKSPNALYSFLPEIGFYTFILVLITFRTGESPTWKWGHKT